MTLYLAVTGDQYELPLFVSESVHSMAAWAGVKVGTVRTAVWKNRNKPPFLPNQMTCKFRFRKIDIEEDE